MTWRRLLIPGALLGAAVVLTVVTASLPGGGSGSPSDTATGSRRGQPRGSQEHPLRLTALAFPTRLQAPTSGETVVARPDGLLVIGGLDGAGASTSSVLDFDPATGTTRSAGSLSQPLHDAAATAVRGGVLVFGGGSTTTLDEVERLAPGRAGQIVGHLPQTRSDLSTLTVGETAVLLGGYDGARPLGSVLETQDGRSFTTLAHLRVPVRYASVAARGDHLFVLGGELANGTDTAEIQSVDLSTGATSIVGRLPAGLSHASAVTLRARVLLLGGRREGRTTDQVLRFDPHRVLSRQVGRLPAPVQNAAAGVVGNTAYLIGGLDPSGRPLETIDQLRLNPVAPLNPTR